jgi:hypothetical protein
LKCSLESFKFVSQSLVTLSNLSTCSYLHFIATAFAHQPPPTQPFLLLTLTSYLLFSIAQRPRPSAYLEIPPFLLQPSAGTSPFPGQCRAPELCSKF